MELEAMQEEALNEKQVKERLELLDEEREIELEELRKAYRMKSEELAEMHSALMRNTNVGWDFKLENADEAT